MLTGILYRQTKDQLTLCLFTNNRLTDTCLSGQVENVKSTLCRLYVLHCL